MEKEIAKELMDEIVKLSNQMNVITSKIDEIPSASERKEMLTHIANVIAASDENLFRPILRQYPELEPLNRHHPSRHSAAVENVAFRTRLATAFH